MESNSPIDKLTTNINRLEDMIKIHFKKLNDILDQITPDQIIPYEPVESEIVIVCHCSKKYQKHDPLFYIKNKKIIKELGNDVQYVDPTCKDDKWEKIDDESKMYIWNINCPIYISYSDSKVINDILKNSLRVLKKNGKVFFAVMIRPFGDQNIRLFEYFNSNHFNGFTFTLESITRFPYNINKAPYDINQYYVFTKN
jgi:hypothetical protein